MAVSNGINGSDPLMSLRRDFCQLSDDGRPLEQKLDFVHQVLGREMAEVRPFLDRIEKTVGSLSDADRQKPAVARALDAIARDESARKRYLAFAHDADQPPVRARMVKLAQRLGWLSPEAERAELIGLIRDRLAGPLSPADVELACGLNDHHELDGEASTLEASLGPTATLAQASVLACLDSASARSQVLPALTTARDGDFEMAQVYLRHRPLTDAGELRAATSSIAHASDAKVQVRALDTLAGQHLTDPESLEELTRLFPVAQTPSEKEAIAGVLLRADYESIATPEVVEILRESRLKSHSHADLVDVLIRRLEAQ